MRFTLEQLLDATVENLDGTCTHGSWEAGVQGALYSLISEEYGSDWRSHMSEIDDLANELEEEATEMLEGHIEEYMQNQSFGLCPDCGWWGQDLIYSNGQTDESVCDECQCEEEEEEE